MKLVAPASKCSALAPGGNTGVDNVQQVYAIHSDRNGARHCDGDAGFQLSSRSTGGNRGRRKSDRHAVPAPDQDDHSTLGVRDLGRGNPPHGKRSKLGRIFAKTMGWFISASFISLLLGLIMVNLLQPGANFPGTLPAAGQSTGLPVSAFSIEKFLTHLIPTSIADAMAQNEILQIVIFAVFFSVAMGAMPERSKPMLALIDDLGHIMLKVTGYVMLFAPLAVWAAIMATVSKNGLGVLWKLIQFMGGFYLSLAILWAILVVVGFIVIGPRYSHLLRLIREPLMIAFSTASSEAAYPKTLEGLNKFGASSRISAFVLPLGYSFNLDGTMMYCTFASIFIAQTYH